MPRTQMWNADRRMWMDRDVAEWRKPGPSLFRFIKLPQEENPMPLTLVRNGHTQNEIFDIIERFAGKEAALPRSEWMLNTRLEQLDFDSLSRVELAMELEDELDTTFPDQAIENCETIGEVMKVVAERLA